ncbi:DUF6660 family protein [Ekhidna sp.]|uniref:DUF6660 family protein n=1 Tax=Ekhidna sp. TaxID=2608089 RepID=UPI003C79F7AE
MRELLLKQCKQVALLFRYCCIVKSFAFILSLFLLGLSVAPCTDETTADSIEVSYQESGSDHDHNESEDLCSPLCVCHCCHSHLVVQQIFISELGILTFPLQRSTYSDPITSGFVGSLLQPPQV